MAWSGWTWRLRRSPGTSASSDVRLDVHQHIGDLGSSLHDRVLYGMAGLVSPENAHCGINLQMQIDVEMGSHFANEDFLDVIRAVNGETVGSATDVRAALAKVEEGGRVELTVIRKGDPLKLLANR